MITKRKAELFKFFLRVYGGLSFLLFGFLTLGLFFHWPVLDKGGALNWTVWDDMSDHVPLMITTIYLVWSIFIFRAAEDPERNASFLDFTMWANLAHGLVMVPQAASMHMYHSKFMTDIPWVLVLSAGIALLGPRPKWRADAATTIRQ